MTNEVVVTFKGKTGQDPWIVVHAEPNLINQALDTISPELIGKVHHTQELFNAGPGLAQLVEPPQQGAPWDQPQQQPTHQAPPATTSAPVQPAQGQNPDVKIWTGPNPAKPQYEATFFQVPFISDKATRDAFFKELKDGAWAKPHDSNTKPWTYIAPKGGTEQFVRDTIARYAPHFT